MIPKILHDEALHSYMQRIVHLNGESKKFSKIKALIPKAIDNLTIKTVASTLQWPGCHGFNRILHSHTNYALQGIIKKESDLTYSCKKYVSRSRSDKLDLTRYKYCPECCRDDISKIGFAYWRRSHQMGINACSRHRTKLIDSCPYCDKYFTSGYNSSFIWPGASRSEEEKASQSLSGHLLDTLWLGCSGRSIFNVVSEYHTNSYELRKSSFLDGLLKYNFHIPLEIATDALSEKLESISLSWAKKFIDNIDEYWWLYSLAPQISKSCRLETRLLSHQELFRAMVAIYGTFEEYIAELNSMQQLRRPIESLWSTFAFGSRGSISFIEESNSPGLGKWFYR